MCGLTANLPHTIMPDGPNHKANFERGILNARNNLMLIVKYLRYNSVEPNYKEYLEVYVPKLEGTEYYDEFKKELDKLKEEEKPDEMLAGEDKEATEEETFRALSAAKQKELINEKLKGKERKEGDDSNVEKRVSLYFS